MLLDTLKLKLVAGRGGDGIVRFDSQKRPNGGSGGKGGNIILKGSSHLFDFRKLANKEVYEAENGEAGGNNDLTGKYGKDYTLLVPLKTIIFNEETNEPLGEISNDGEELLICEGGAGGFGNHYFRKGQVQTLYKSTKGANGEAKEVRFQLEIQSDIILIGFPNAGKSSLLNELTEAHVKVAPYEFTTIDPQLGRIDGVTVMDLPGLIEKTFEGKGLGTKFLKHTKSSKVLAHIVSLENDDFIKKYRKMRKELENISKELSDKKEIVILTKSDVFEDNRLELQKRVEQMQKLNKNLIVTSSFDLESIEKLKVFLKESLN